jgi:predicted DCC family thiol-disulfide oxidoreductase YuxK
MGPPPAPPPELIFYDGHCGLCHRGVRFVLARDKGGTAFRFAPLGGESFQALVPENVRGGLPDSLIVRTADGRLLTRGQGMRHILRRLGGPWRLLGGLLGLLPVRFLDWTYDGVARVRHRLFARPPEACPLVPPALRSRFDA